MKIKIGDTVVINKKFVEEVLSADTHKRTIATIQHLGHCGSGSCKVTELDRVDIGDEKIYFVRLVPEDETAYGYHQGKGILVFFTSEEHRSGSLDKKMKKRVTKPKSKPTKSVETKKKRATKPKSKKVTETSESES